MDPEYHLLCSSTINGITGQYFWIIYTSDEIMEVLLIIWLKVFLFWFVFTFKKTEDLEQFYFELSHSYS